MILSLKFSTANEINEVLKNNPSTLEFINALDRCQLEFHHSATARGYVSRKDINGYAEPYEGRFGSGIIIHKPRWDTTNYHTIVYYTFNFGDNGNKLKLYGHIANIASELVTKTPISGLTGAFPDFASAFAYVYAGMRDNEISFESVCNDFLARCSETECELGFKLCCRVQDVQMTGCYLNAHRHSRFSAAEENLL